VSLSLDHFAAHFHLNSLLLLPTEVSENHSQSCVPTFTSIVHAFVCSRIDYCNSLLIDLPKTWLSPLQIVLNRVARLIARLPRYSHISSFIKELHWLPISTCIKYKVLLIVLKVQIGVAPKYLRDGIRLPTSASSLRHLRSLDRRELFVPRTRTTWPCLDRFPLMAFLFGIAFHLQFVLFSYLPIFLVLITS